VEHQGPAHVAHLAEIRLDLGAVDRETGVAASRSSARSRARRWPSSERSIGPASPRQNMSGAAAKNPAAASSSQFLRTSGSTPNTDGTMMTAGARDAGAAT
jgi:hypothetical protein